VSSYGNQQRRDGEVGEYGDGDSITINSSCDSKVKGKGPKKTVFKISSIYYDDEKALPPQKIAAGVGAGGQFGKLTPRPQNLTPPPQNSTPKISQEKSQVFSTRNTPGDRRSSVGSVRIDSAGNYSRGPTTLPPSTTHTSKNLSKSGIDVLNLTIHIQEFSSTPPKKNIAPPFPPLPPLPPLPPPPGCQQPAGPPFPGRAKMDSTPRCSRVVPHPSTERAQAALTSVFG
jgi:hypothetical protein